MTITQRMREESPKTLLKEEVTLRKIRTLGVPWWYSWRVSHFIKSGETSGPQWTWLLFKAGLEERVFWNSSMGEEGDSHWLRVQLKGPRGILSFREEFDARENS